MNRWDTDWAMIQIQLWWLREIQIEWWSRSSSDDPDREMIQIQIQFEWWSRSSPVKMIQIEWWSRSGGDVPWWSRLSDDPDPDPDRVMIQIQFYDDPDLDDLKMKMTWRRRCSSWYREEDQCWKSCRKNTFLVKRECWCICNFEMYSSMYLMYCNPMFIPGCFYYVFESCGHAPMFRSGGLIM